MELDTKLNIVLPVLRDELPAAFVVSQPVNRLVFKAFSLPIAKTWTQMYQEGIHLIGGPPIARDLLEEISKTLLRDGGGTWWEGPAGVENAFLGEIRRITVVFAPDGAGGWGQMMLEEAIKKKVVDQDLLDEIEGGLVFFMLNWRMLPAVARQSMIGAAGRVWGWRISSSSISELRATFPPSIKTETSETKARASSTIR